MNPGPVLSEAMLSAWGRQAFAEPCTGREAVAFPGWDTLGRLLAAGADVLVADKGREAPVPAPRSLDAARRCLDDGVSIVVRRAERHDAGLRALALALERRFGGPVHVQVFVTPAAGQTFGWHYDDEQVLVLQTLGCKQYWFCRNTVVGDTARADFAAFARETSPLMTATLRAGDRLHLPRGHWHMARAQAESMHLSIGVGARRG